MQNLESNIPALMWRNARIRELEAENKALKLQASEAAANSAALATEREKNIALTTELSKRPPAPKPAPAPVTNATGAKIMTRDAWQALTPAAQASFFRNGGRLAS